MAPVAMKWWNKQPIYRKTPAHGRFLGFFCILALPCSVFAEINGAVTFKENVQPLLAKYCYDCHGEGMNKGKVTFDEFKSHQEMVSKRDLWWAALKNLRAGIMPPEKKPRPSPAEQAQFERWVKSEVFGTDPANPDPGRVTIRRLNRVEYRNTIRDLMGTDFKADDEFPPDDTGYGFDNIGDVLTVSPLLLEKYMQAAETIVATAVPTVRKVVQEKAVSGAEFRMAGVKETGERLSFFKPANVSHSFKVDQAGDYRLAMDLDVAGAFDFDPGRCRVLIKLDDRELSAKEFGWHNNKRFHFDFSEKWQPSSHQLSFELQPIPAPEKPATADKPEASEAVNADAAAKNDGAEKKKGDGKQTEAKRNALDLKIVSVKIQGPLDQRYWVRPKNFTLFFPREKPPNNRAAQRAYAREVLARFTEKAFRRPVDDRAINRLLAIAENGYTQPGKVFEEGIGQAMIAILASPRFLFRVEETESRLATTSFPFVDEYALASRLSYFLWAAMPDEELFALAGRRELRKQLRAQVKRMLADKRSDGFMRNFTGQWLQVRDVEGIAINERMVLARDAGEEKELQRELEQFRARFANRQSRTNRDQRTGERQFKRPRLFEKAKVELDGELRRAMQQETELSFGYVVRENRSVLELLDADYIYANEKLAHHYGLPEIKGNEMRRVTLPKDSARGGLLTEGTVLLVTSNPTRTSPVKRGLFILDNILGTPTAPPPPDVPLLEESEKAFKDHEPTLREILELHRNKPLCSSCHSRMDPLGLALENFNAMGMWREKERGQAIDTIGKLITGETFHNVRELKHILKDKRRLDFYRCLTEKLLTYALGRGLDYYDVETVDQIVTSLEKNDGQFSALLMGVVESAPFQKRRNVSPVTAESHAQSSKGEADILQP